MSCFPRPKIALKSKKKSSTIEIIALGRHPLCLGFKTLIIGRLLNKTTLKMIRDEMKRDQLFSFTNCHDESHFGFVLFIIY